MGYKFSGHLATSDKKPFEGECMTTVKGLLLVNVNTSKGDWKLAVTDPDLAKRMREVQSGTHIKFNAESTETKKGDRTYKNWNMTGFVTELPVVRPRNIVPDTDVTKNSIDTQVIFKEYCECRRHGLNPGEAEEVVTDGWRVAHETLAVRPKEDKRPNYDDPNYGDDYGDEVPTSAYNDEEPF